jgi:nucleoid-associated protein EbfC|tara:strand:- start:172 stop:498 length:327 start_codon:yes stop_codon:yes gene_type:complete
MFGDLMGKLEEAKKKTEATKQRLNGVYVNGSSPQGKVKVVATANSEIKEIEIAEELMQADKEELADFLILALNDALKNAKNVHEAEMGAAAKDMMPNIPGMGGLGKMF